jgi:hypothetical protein
MRRMMAVLVVAGVAGVAGCESHKVVRDHSVAAQFAAFNKNGWSVSSAEQPKSKAKAKARPVASSNTGMFLDNVHWTTNLKVDDPAFGSPGGPSVTQNAAAPSLGVKPADGGGVSGNGGLAPGASPDMMGPAVPSLPAGGPGTGGPSSGGVVPAR